MAFDKLKGLMGNVKDTANKYLNQENMERIVGEVKNAAMDAKNAATDIKNSVTEYMNQDPTERAIAKLDREKEEHLKKASLILSRDFSQERAGHKFYIDNNYDKPYNQAQWLKLYEELSAKEDPQALAPMYNAVVVSEHGYYARRGLEPLSASSITFVPGENDEVTHTYAYEPYTYTKNVKAMKLAQLRRAQKAASIPTSSYTPPTTASRGQPEAPKALSFGEKSELNMARRRYNEAVDSLKFKPNDPIRMAEEKKAHAEYMAVMAKFAGRM